MKLEIVNLREFFFIDRHGQKDPWEGLSEEDKQGGRFL